jgi:hypothetical protein
MFAPGMAGAETLKCHPPTFEWAIFFDSLHAIGAASRRKPAFHPEKRRDSALVKAYDSHK